MMKRYYVSGIVGGKSHRTWSTDSADEAERWYQAAANDPRVTHPQKYIRRPGGHYERLGMRA